MKLEMCCEEWSLIRLEAESLSLPCCFPSTFPYCGSPLLSDVNGDEIPNAG